MAGDMKVSFSFWVIFFLTQLSLKFVPKDPLIDSTYIRIASVMTWQETGHMSLPKIDGLVQERRNSIANAL